ncbi:DUF3135 domain-containing protein [uncultured Azohydromonas sp.]|uniref:DUF3135 domain-containing protein n=1 Tax=uncultured Azohydromonas sp. TaxID=487342 RepID=UPI0026051A42|nr:DUF3135 domain-containing protein [uncultured Azohydromonas sp.]
MEPIFDFDRFSQLAHEDPMAFEAQRQALFAAALDEMPPSVQGAARACLAQVQVRMLGARTPAGRLAVAMSALGDSVQALHMSVACLNREAVYMSALRS